MNLWLGLGLPSTSDSRQPRPATTRNAFAANMDSTDEGHILTEDQARAVPDLNNDNVSTLTGALSLSPIAPRLTSFYAIDLVLC